MAYATTDSKLTNLDADNFFETTLKTLVTDGTDTNIYLNSLPDPSEGFLTIEPTNGSTREIIFYNAKGADYVTCPSASAGRGVGGTTAQGHAVSSVVRMAPVAEIWRVLRDRHSALALGWEPADTTHTCGSDNVITVPSDATTKYPVGGKLKIVVSGTTYYGYIIATSSTSVTGVFGTAAGAAYTLSSGATITSMWYSNASSPVGFPGVFSFACNTYANNGTTGLTEVVTAKFWMDGHAVKGFLNIATSTNPGGNKIYWDLPVPTTAVNVARSIGSGFAQSDTTAMMGYLHILSNATTKGAAYLYGEAVWSTTNNYIEMNFEYSV